MNLNNPWLIVAGVVVLFWLHRTGRLAGLLAFLKAPAPVAPPIAPPAVTPGSPVAGFPVPLPQLLFWIATTAGPLVYKWLKGRFPGLPTAETPAEFAAPPVTPPVQTVRVEVVTVAPSAEAK